MNEVDNMEFSEKVRFVRKKLEMSQEDLAHALNVSFYTINRWENEKTKPIKMARGIFDTFCKSHGISFDESVVNKNG
jgi:DNA-binding transcriptional regulator YiaG